MVTSINSILEMYWLINYTQVECLDIIFYIKLSYVELIKILYVISNLRILMEKPNNYYGFQVDQPILNILEETDSDIYFSVKSMIRYISEGNYIEQFQVKTVYPQFVFTRFKNDDYEINNYVSSSRLVYLITLNRFEAIMEKLILIIIDELYSYNQWHITNRVIILRG